MDKISLELLRLCDDVLGFAKGYRERLESAKGDKGKTTDVQRDRAMQKLSRASTWGKGNKEGKAQAHALLGKLKEQVYQKAGGEGGKRCGVMTSSGHRCMRKTKGGPCFQHVNGSKAAEAAPKAEDSLKERVSRAAWEDVFGKSDSQSKKISDYDAAYAKWKENLLAEKLEKGEDEELVKLQNERGTGPFSNDEFEENNPEMIDNEDMETARALAKKAEDYDDYLHLLRMNRVDINKFDEKGKADKRRWAFGEIYDQERGDDVSTEEESKPKSVEKVASKHKIKRKKAPRYFIPGVGFAFNVPTRDLNSLKRKVKKVKEKRKNGQSVKEQQQRPLTEEEKTRISKSIDDLNKKLNDLKPHETFAAGNLKKGIELLKKAKTHGEHVIAMNHYVREATGEMGENEDRIQEITERVKRTMGEEGVDIEKAIKHVLTPLSNGNFVMRGKHIPYNIKPELLIEAKRRIKQEKA